MKEKVLKSLLEILCEVWILFGMQWNEYVKKYWDWTLVTCQAAFWWFNEPYSK